MGRKGKSKATLAREQKERMQRNREGKNASIELAPRGEEKLLARRLASLREKNPTNAQGLATPLGSLSIPDKPIRGMPTSSDSPEGVCTPMRVPSPEGVAGQTKLVEKTCGCVTSIKGTLTKLHEHIEKNNDELEMKNENIDEHKTENTDDKYENNSEYNTETIVENNEFITDKSKNIEINSLNCFIEREIETNPLNNCSKDYEANIDLSDEFCVHDFRDSTVRSQVKTDSPINIHVANADGTDGQVREIYADDIGINNDKFIVQGSFHQGDVRFGNNRGKQCVANSLTALVYSKLSLISTWNRTFLDRILNEGNELYTFIHGDNDELLVTELPEMLEIANVLLRCKRSESILAMLDNTGFTSFNVFPLGNALQDALLTSDGCLVCVKGFTCAIIKQNEKMYLFDSHARNSEGLSDCNGKSIVTEIKDMNTLNDHFVTFVQGDPCVEFEVTAIQIHIERKLSNYQMPNSRCIGDVLEGVQFDSITDVECISSDTHTFSFYPLDYHNKKKLCTILDVSSKHVSGKTSTHATCTIGNPSKCKQITPDGNCLFRAISFAISQRQEYFSQVRKGIVNHILSYPQQFNSYLDHETVEDYVRHSGMYNNNVWGTHLEILAAADLLQTDIFTFFEGKWIKYSSKQINSSNFVKEQAIYLKNEGYHFEVVLSVQSKNDNNVETDAPSAAKIRKREREKLRYHSSVEVRQNKIKYGLEKYHTHEQFREQLIKKTVTKYHTDDDFKKTTLENSKRISKFKYWNDLDYKENKNDKMKNTYQTNDTYRETVKAGSKRKYKSDEVHKEAVKSASKQKYELNELHRETVKSASKQKYELNELHRETVKSASKQKYELNELHRETVKSASKQKYELNELHRETVKSASKQKYELNELHRETVKSASKQKYELNELHRETVKSASKQKYELNELHRETVKSASKKKYELNELHRETVKSASKQKYELNELHRNAVKAASKQKYLSDPNHKENIVQATKDRREKKYEEKKDIKKVIENFRLEAKKAPEYVCSCCFRLLFEKQVLLCKTDSYATQNQTVQNLAELCISHKYCHTCTVECSSGCVAGRTRKDLWICLNCHKKILKGKMPAESFVNSVDLEEVPKELANLNSLEQHLIALNIPFMKVLGLPAGGQKGVHGPIISVPSDISKVTSSLPRSNDENLMLRVKLKRKLSYKGYEHYQFVNTKHLEIALQYLKENNKWYDGINFGSSWLNPIPEELNEEIVDPDLTDQSNVGDKLSEIGNINEEEISDSYLDDSLRGLQFDTSLQPADIGQECLDMLFDKVFNLSPAEGNKPVSILQEKGLEAKSFPKHYPSGKNTYDEEREEKLSLLRYFNLRLLSVENRFAKDTSYIFFCQYMAELDRVISNVQISLRKESTFNAEGKKVTSKMLCDKDKLKELFKKDEAIKYLKPVRGTPPYWQATQKELFAMLYQLGIPTFFCSFSAADFRWTEIVEAIIKQQGDVTINLDELDWNEKCKLLRENPVTMARMFEHRWHTFLYDVILSPAEPIGKVVDWFYRVEFQQRGSPHTHCLFWIEGAPKLGEDSDEDVIAFIDKYITCKVPDEKDDPELHEMVTTLHKHSKNHSKSCRKKKGTVCRFNFPRPPSLKTFIARPSDSVDGNVNISDDKDSKKIITTLFEILSSNENISVSEAFEQANISQDKFENIFSSVTKKCTIVLKRDPNEIYTNQYNPDLLRSWNANMDIQFVSDAYGCIGYVIDYISKAERELGLLLLQTMIEAQEGNLSAQQTMKKIGTAYLHNRELSAQEAIFRVTGLKLKECSRKVEFIPVGENPCRMSIPLKELQSREKKRSVETKSIENEDTVDDESHWMTNIVDRYKERPRSAQFESMCCATFCSEYSVLSKSQIPKKINEETTHKLGKDLGYIRKRTRTKPAIVRYARFSVEKTPERYYQSMLQLYLPYRIDEQLKPPKFETFQEFYEHGFIRMNENLELLQVKTIVDNNKASFLKNEKSIQDAEKFLEDFGSLEDAWGCLCPEAETERRQCLDEGSTSTVVEEEISDTSVPDLNMQDGYYSTNLITTTLNRNTVLPLLRSLNLKQQHILYKVRDWCLRKANGMQVEPFHVLVTGGGGTGKSHLIKCLFSEATRILARTTPNPDDITVLLTAPTGTAAFNIDGSTIHSALKIRGLSAEQAILSEDKINSLRSVLDNLHILIIDEISMVNKRLLFMIHSRLRQLKKARENVPFGGVSIIAVGDFYQLPPVRTAKNGKLFINDPSSPVNHLWHDLFSVVELDEVMRQRDDAEFAQMLNRLRVRKKGDKIEMQDVNALKQCINKGPDNALHVFATNDECKSFNNEMVMNVCSEVKLIEAEDYTKEKASGKLVRQKTNFSGKDLHVPLQQSILIGVGARVMLIKNIDIQDGLVNGVMGTVFEVSESSTNSLPKIIFIHFDDERVGKNFKNQKVVNQKFCVGIEPLTEDVSERHGCRKQFPLQLAWACTIHKVQGLTVKECVVDLNKCFSSGQAYVALSRVTSKNGLYINDIDEKKLDSKIFCDPDVSSGISLMTDFLGDFNNTCVGQQLTKIMYHNIQGLVCHKEDLEHNLDFQNADYICITETWLQSESDNVVLKDYEFSHLPRSSAFVENEPLFSSLKDMKCGGVGLFYKHDSDIILLSNCVYNLECMPFKVVHLNLVVVVIYRTQKYPVKKFINNLILCLENVASYSDNIIVVGDLNQDLFKEEQHIYDVLIQKGFNQLVCHSTTEGGTLIDHVYVKGCQVHVTVKPTYYSYHESVEISVVSI